MKSLTLFEHIIHRAVHQETLEWYCEQRVLEWFSVYLIGIRGVLIKPHNYDKGLLALYPFQETKSR
jgi:hypothetical protein